jgi:uncharacterized protein (UPF0276 family)
MKQPFPNLGYGLGLRPKHYPYIFKNKPKIDWFEVISENFMDTDGRPKSNLAKIKELYPIVMHGVSMSIGTVDPINSEYLKKLKSLIKWLSPAWVSDHLCWTGVAHKNTHDLLPVPYTQESLKHIIKRIKKVQDFIEMPIALENPSTYLEFKHSEITEANFISEMAKESGCNLLLDVNNIYVTCYNHRLDIKEYIDSLPLEKVIQIHLSGHTNKGSHIIDTHDNHVIDEVWNLYKYVIYKAGRVPNTMIEWDDKIPEFTVLKKELDKAKKAAKTANEYILPQIEVNKPTKNRSKKLDLKKAQNLMQDSIIFGNNFKSNPNDWIKTKKDFTPKNQLNVYFNAYRYRLNDVAAEDYPVLKKYLGESLFNDLIWNFVNSEYSEHFNIGRFALKLPDFLKKFLPKNIFAYELCLLETEISQIQDYTETNPLEQKHIEGVTPEIFIKSKLYPRTALKLFKFKNPINKYYSSVMQGKNSENIVNKPSYLVVFRHDNIVWRMDLEAQEYNLLNHCFSGIEIGKALEKNSKLSPEKLFQYFSKWMSNGLLAAHEYNNKDYIKPKKRKKNAYN